MGRDELIEQLVTTWEELRRRGQTTSVQELCREHPELVESVWEALTRSEEQDGEPAATGDVATSRADDLEATRDVLGRAQELDKLTRLGPFRIVKLIAEGGMGAVYEAADHELGRSVALKVMRPEVAGHEKARARFLREARAAAALDHDHIVMIYKVGEEQGIPYLAMQLLHGQTLNERLHQGPPLSNAEVLRIGREIAQGLAVAHASGLVHRDIKPANIWLEEGTSRVKILDFGLARAANETARLTQDGSLLGTPAYMSPEQASSSGELDHRSDLFSLGSVLYRMVTGRLAFPAESLAELLLGLVRDDPVAPRQLNPGIPPALDELILRLLAKDPAARPQSAQAVVETIRKLEKATVPGAWDGLDLKVQVKDEGALAPRAPKRFPFAVAALVIVAGLAAVAPWLFPWILDAAGNRGELILESPERAVAVTVTRGGRTAGVLDPEIQPALRLPAGLYGLELADATGTLVLASTEVDLHQGSRQVVKLVRDIRAAAARDRAATVIAALDQARDRAAKARVIAAAAPLQGMLEKLAERAAGDALFQAELARHFAEQGNAPLADAARTRARARYEQQRAAEPSNATLASELADLLLSDNRASWTVLKPTEMKSEAGATLSLQSDGSILASGINAGGDIYTVSTVSNLDHIAAVRLEALPDPSFPHNGPGRHSSGNFQLSAFRLHRPAQEDLNVITSVPVESACASFDYKASNADIAGTIDEGLNKVWHVLGRSGEAHQAVFLVQETGAPSRGRPLVIELRHQGSGEGINLGRFRLSVSGDPAIFGRERHRFAAMTLADPWARLAAADRLAGDQTALDRLLEQRPAAVAGLGDLYAADQDWEQAIAAYRKSIIHQPADDTLLTRLAKAYRSAGRTREAVPHLATLSSAHPEDTMLSMKVAALQAWFGQHNELAATRQRVLAFARDTNSAHTADRAAKVCSILPCTEPAELEAALTLGRTAVKLGPDGGWNLLALGMAEYRSGNDDDAEKALRAAADASPTNRYVTGTAQFFRAMSLFRQGKPDEAKRLAIAAAATMNPLPADERNPPPGTDDHNDLILWLAYKEAKALIRFDAPAAAPAPPGPK